MINKNLTDISHQVGTMIGDAIHKGSVDTILDRRIGEYVKQKVRDHVAERLKTIDLNGLIDKTLSNNDLYIDKIEKIIIQSAAERIRLTMNEVKHEITKRRLGEKS